MDKPRPIVRLRCAVKHYEWGPVGHQSHVARLAQSNSAQHLDLTRPYAEFWMGTHPSGPSYLDADADADADAIPLKHWIQQNPSLLGDKIADKWGPDLPFLFKVLSVAKALSIQAHPDKKLAELLHKSRPDIYKDANHKPEMAVAITDFKALCGFVTVEEVQDVLATVPEVRELIGTVENGNVFIGSTDPKCNGCNPRINGNGCMNGENGNRFTLEENGNGCVNGENGNRFTLEENGNGCVKGEKGNRFTLEENGNGCVNGKNGNMFTLEKNGNGCVNGENGNRFTLEENGNGAVVHKESDKSKAYLKSIFTMLMTASQDAVSNAIQKLKSRLVAENKTRSLTEKEQLILKLEQQYPGDVGVISAFFFNYVILSPGEALYLDANEPHAYLYGECIECMATSDNVVRAGLTPKFRDVQTLCSMLTYKQGFPEILRGVPLNKNVCRYTPPFDEFEVERWSLLPDEAVTFRAVPGPSIFLVLSGTASITVDSLNEMETFPEGDVFFVSANTEANIRNAAAAPLVLFRAGVNERIFD